MWSIQSFWPLLGVKQIAPTRRSDQIAACISIEGGPLKPISLLDITDINSPSTKISHLL